MKTNIYLSDPKSSLGATHLHGVAFIVLLLLITTGSAFAQGETSVPHIVKGKVVSSEDGTPIAGANVIWQGTSVGTLTDGEGKFVFPQPLKEGDVLLFSFVSMQTYVHKVSTKEADENLEIKMQVSYEIVGDLNADQVYDGKRLAKNK